MFDVYALSILDVIVETGLKAVKRALALQVAPELTEDIISCAVNSIMLFLT